MPDSETVTGTRRALGTQLAALRETAGYTQATLGKLVGFARSTLASVEAGQSGSRELWEACDKVLDGAGSLTTAYDQIEKLRRKHHEDAAAVAAAERAERVRQWQAKHESAQAPIGAGGGVVVTANIDPAALDVIQRTFLGVTATTDTADDLSSHDDLERRVLDAYRRQDGRGEHRLSVTLVGGFAGSGKSEFARFLSDVTGWTILDKDTITRALVEQLLISLGGDHNDRHTPLYQTRVRPHEYQCLLDAAVENLGCGISTVLTAPFLREFADSAWLQRVQNRCASHNAVFTVVWVTCDTESMYDYLRFRGASRDAWKLANWQDYLETIDPEFEPTFPHCTVDNRLNAAVALADQARELALRVRRAL